MTQTYSPTGKHSITNLYHLDGKQMTIKSGPTVVCFRDVSQLATEEVAIYRPMGQADHLSSLVVKQLNSGSNASVFLCTIGSNYACAFGRLYLFLYACVCISVEDGAVEDAFSHFVFLLSVMQECRNAITAS